MAALKSEQNESTESKNLPGSQWKSDEGVSPNDVMWKNPDIEFNWSELLSSWEQVHNWIDHDQKMRKMPILYKKYSLSKN